MMLVRGQSDGMGRSLSLLPVGTALVVVIPPSRPALLAKQQP